MAYQLIPLVLNLSRILAHSQPDVDCKWTRTKLFFNNLRDQTCEIIAGTNNTVETNRSVNEHKSEFATDETKLHMDVLKFEPIIGNYH